jgi:hypothetical protein
MADAWLLAVAGVNLRASEVAGRNKELDENDVYESTRAAKHRMQ